MGRAASAIARTGAILSSIPRMLIMAADGVRREVDPSGRDRIARRWFSN